MVLCCDTNEDVSPRNNIYLTVYPVQPQFQFTIMIEYIDLCLGIILT